MGDSLRPSLATSLLHLPPDLSAGLLACGDGASHARLARACRLLAQQEEGERSWGPAWHQQEQQSQEEAHFIASQLLQLAWEKLHEGHWKDVPLVWRQLYAYAALVVAIVLVRQNRFDKALSTLDLALLMGGGPHAMPHRLWEDLHHLIRHCQTQWRHSEEAKAVRHGENKEEKRTRNEGKEDDGQGGEDAQGDDEEEEEEEEEARPSCLNLRPVQRVHRPSMEKFFREYMQKGIPVIITGMMEGWPAMNERAWANMSYLKSVAGPRTVPVEVGRNYLHPEWGQRLMTFAEFVDDYVCNPRRKASDRGYLAQVELFELVPELRRDFGLPEYCGLGECEDIKIQAWFGPKGTISPLHEDPYHNLLAQVVGRKRIQLYSPSNNPFLYPHTGKTLKNTSQIDVEHPDTERFPLFAQAQGEELFLEAGEMLYLPPHYWHFVRSLSTSFSISFWWS